MKNEIHLEKTVLHQVPSIGILSVLKHMKNIHGQYTTVRYSSSYIVKELLAIDFHMYLFLFL